MPKSPAVNIGLRVPVELQERIDHAAERNGQTRTAYILSWLPVTYDHSAEQAAYQAAQGERVVQRRRRSSPAPE